MKNKAFIRPKQLKSSLQLLEWLIFDVKLLEGYEKKLNRKQTVWLVLKTYCLWIVPLAIFLWLLGSIVVVCWKSHIGIDIKYFFFEEWRSFVENTWYTLLVVGLTFGLVVGLVVGLVAGLTFGLVVGLTFSLTICLSLNLFAGFSIYLPMDLSIGLALGLSVGLALGLSVGLILVLSFGLVGGLTVGLGVGLAVGLILSLVVGLTGGVIGGIICSLSWLIMYFRLPFYLSYEIQILWSSRLDNNLYLKDAGICLPIWWLEKKMIKQVQDNPLLAQELIYFLLQYRPLQRSLTLELWHCATSSQWQHYPLQVKVLTIPNIRKKDKQFQPSVAWQKQLEVVDNALNTYQEQSNLQLKQQYFQQFQEALQKWKEINLLENPTWNKHYFPFFEQWEKEAAIEAGKLNLRLESTEPIGKNIYRENDPLRPVLEDDLQLFLGREDIKEKLSLKILTAPTMPLLLLQGQRRVGKSSLLNFLPEILDRSIFKVVYQDFQNDGHSVLYWLVSLRQKINQYLGIKEESLWKPSAQSWVEAWLEFRAYIEGLALEEGIKLILAFDEYEALHKSLSEDVEQAEQLLGAMRSFSQHQNQIVFLFVGAAFLRDLNAPNWSRFFVNVETLQIGYLNKTDSLRLITEPVPNLRYEAGIPERIYELTQGHPAIIQSICRQLVVLANQQNTHQITVRDLEEVLDTKILDRNYPPIYIFWESEFCNPNIHPLAQITVRHIIRQEPIPKDHIPSLRRLLDHKYILKNPKDAAYPYRLHVPLFQQWIERNDWELSN